MAFVSLLLGFHWRYKIFDFQSLFAWHQAILEKGIQSGLGSETSPTSYRHSLGSKLPDCNGGGRIPSGSEAVSTSQAEIQRGLSEQSSLHCKSRVRAKSCSLRAGALRFFWRWTPTPARRIMACKSIFSAPVVLSQRVSQSSWAQK